MQHSVPRALSVRPQAHCAGLCWVGSCTPCRVRSPLTIQVPPGPGAEGTHHATSPFPLLIPLVVSTVLYSSIPRRPFVSKPPESHQAMHGSAVLTAPCASSHAKHPQTILRAALSSFLGKRKQPNRCGCLQVQLGTLCFFFSFFFFPGAGNWLQVFLLRLCAGRALRRERLCRGCWPPTHCTSSAARAGGNWSHFPPHTSRSGSAWLRTGAEATILSMASPA